MAIVGVTVGKVRTVGWPHVYVWQGFCHYEHGWSPIQELLGGSGRYSLSDLGMTDCSHHAATPSH